MFWKKSHKLYGHINTEDEDIKRYLRVSTELQKDGYKGLLGWIQDMGHRWVSKYTTQQRVLEIGFGGGRHAFFFQGEAKDYFVSEYSKDYIDSGTWENFKGRGVLCDATRLSFGTGMFEQVLSLYNLEHIKDLRSVLMEVKRVLRPGGRFILAVPCEGGFLWNFGRELTTRRMFSKKYSINYDKVIAYEHVWSLPGILKEIRESELFQIDRIELLPFRIPSYHLNLIACLQCTVVK